MCEEWLQKEAIQTSCLLALKVMGKLEGNFGIFPSYYLRLIAVERDMMSSALSNLATLVV